MFCIKPYYSRAYSRTNCFCLSSACFSNNPKTKTQVWFIYKQMNMNELFIKPNSSCSWTVWFIYSPSRYQKISIVISIVGLIYYVLTHSLFLSLSFCIFFLIFFHIYYHNIIAMSHIFFLLLELCCIYTNSWIAVNVGYYLALQLL